MSGRGEAKRIRVALVDDQGLFRAGIRMLVDSQPDLEVVAEASDGREALDVVRASRPDVVLMDIRMPVMDGLAATAELLADSDPPRIVMLTTFDLDEAAARAIRQGASGFLLKDADPEFLLAAIRTVHSGSAVIAASATRDLFAHFADAAPRAVPAEIARIVSPVDDREKALAIFTDVFDGVLRHFAAILHQDGTLPESEFWALVGDSVDEHAAEHPDLDSAVDLRADAFAHSCLNRLQLRNTLQMVDLADQSSSLMYAGELANPIARSRSGAALVGAAGSLAR